MDNTLHDKTPLENKVNLYPAGLFLTHMYFLSVIERLESFALGYDVSNKLKRRKNNSEKI
ncbi:hypothetical protein OSO01_03880 [Oceanobacillus sojae]|uniref:Uncharacterized protein n=1 Tax=Oceanobacillus sojae TaxID=582851 RepID=A0A511ZDY0_9BACI|nr:hypothetical protein OSO01_03880 [Oceanobacillus sojae]